MPINWATDKEIRSLQLEKLAKVGQTRIRRSIGTRGFFCAGREVQEGEVVECDFDIAASLIAVGKAERV